MFKFDLSNLKGDIYGGLTAGVVALPLALAMGVASGLGPISGLYGAIIVGFFASFFGGTGAQITGPTGPMTVVVAGLVASLASIPGMQGEAALIFTAIFLAGVIQVIMGVLKLGEFIRLVPYPVISGFMSGIGGIIIILQIGPLLGHPSPAGTVDALLSAPAAMAAINPMALVLGVLTLAIALKWPKKLAVYVPGPLAALIIGTLVSVVVGGVPVFTLPVFNQDAIFLVLEAAFVLALLGAIDSLLTSLVADNMTRTRHNSNRELIGQGIGNAVAGLFGGTASAGATMRTVVNIRTGGKTRLSGMIHALVLLAIVLGLSPLAAQIPNAVLGGILVKVGLDIIDWSYLKNAHRGPRWDLGLMLMVFGLTVFVDLITAVAAGVVMASLYFVHQVAKEQTERIRAIHTVRHSATDRELELLDEAGNDVIVFDFSGPMSFGAAADLGHHARSILSTGGAKVLILDFERVPKLDVSSALAIETVARDANASGRIVYLCAMSPDVLSVLESLEADEHLPQSGHFETLEEALEAALPAIHELQKKSKVKGSLEGSQQPAIA
jgi:SulP family sulfate permease